ncbi:uncharacterized protein LOC117645387 isoform X2 [Thrips palmi]|uniref:Uncharacterized protein LOC117645387 isoform X2 n=1 Tax=Thrips palmi TaxID=161013 RepID=A0A6P8Z486_THRPL|nr:uncharacterized protein LOC117645387 isoform X2 [Thrips palmi]
MKPSVPLLVAATLTLLWSAASGDAPTANKCNMVCGRNYDPVCGEDQGVQKTFSNRCMMEYYNCLKGTDFVIVILDECANEEKLPF